MGGNGIYTDRDVNSLSELYHTNTKLNSWNAPEYADKINTYYAFSAASGSGIKQPSKPYPWAQSISLSLNFGNTDITMEQAIGGRRTAHAFSGKQMSKEQVSFILRFSAGITDKERALRAHPSGGALYPLEVYVLAFAVTDLESGLYHYEVYEHCLRKIEAGDFREEFAKSVSAENVVELSAVAIVISAIFYRSEIKYGERGYRLVLLEAGHLGQNILLCASAQKAAAVPLGGFLDDDVNRILRLDGIEESVIYPILLGV